MPRLENLISEEQRRKISESVRRSEFSTSCEIVPMLVLRSCVVGHVPRLMFLIFVLMALSFSFPSFLLSYFELTSSSPLQAQILTLSGLALMLLIFWALSIRLSRSRFLQRLLTSKEDQIFQVEERALLEFHQHHLSQTQYRNAILIFVSWTEQRAVILGDKAISDLLPPGTWDQILQQMLVRMKEGAYAEAYIAAIEQCGKILTQHFPIQNGDKNEICNQLIIKE